MLGRTRVLNLYSCTQPDSVCTTIALKKGTCQGKVALYFMFYKVHQTLRVTPAMEVGLADHVWSLRKSLGYSSGDIEIFHGL